jgi:meso-butanediol dehydrogenase/(S,S)-butanediol dehydrogenase/diacetyl reductase
MTLDAPLSRPGPVMSHNSQSGRVALVTGAGSGIGRATALRLAADGHRVALVGRRRHALDETAADVAGTDRALVLPCDVTDRTAVRATATTILDTFGRIDVLINNAGISATAPFAEVTLDLWRQVMAVDVESVVTVTQAALPALLDNQGCIVNVASLAGLGGDPKMTIYNTAKGAVVNLTRSLAVELAPHGVRVNAVAPSLTTTDATADIPDTDRAEFIKRIPMGRAAAPSEVADVIAFLAGPDSRFVTGVVLPVDGGLRASSGQPPHR